MIARTLTLAMLTATLLPAASYAADTSTTANSNANAAQQIQALPQQITQKLKQDGFSNVKIEPGSFIVAAKDKNGNPVEMLIRPNSMLIIAAENSNNNGNGSASNNNTAHSNGNSQ